LPWAVRAQAWLEPATTSTASLIVDTGRGTKLAVFVPLPS
jgi:hypothetical protein